MNFFSLFKRKIIYQLKKKISIDDDFINDKLLDKLFHKYGSDKANTFIKNNFQGHGFSKFYAKHLDKLKNKKINILEIGSYSGASAAAFVKYFPYSKVFCFDINISNFKYKSKNIHVYGLDINNKNQVNKTLNQIYKKNNFQKFDLIIDDGSHNLKDILVSLNSFFSHLKDKNFFIIEDFKHPNYYEYNRDINHILVDKVLENLKNKIVFNSSIMDEKDQLIIMNSIEKIFFYKGNLENSDICFIQKI